MKANFNRNEFRLFSKIIELSKADNWEEAKLEWECIEITQRQDDDLGSCTCGKYPIKHEIQMFNYATQNEIIVGNCCIKKFFEIKEFSKVFNALKKNKINKFMIDYCFGKKIINEWEHDFAINTWRKKYLSKKQKIKFKIIKEKIIRYYKSKK